MRPDSIQHGIVLLETLERLHKRDLVHRDVKPSNIFLTAHGLKLLDFGLARSLTPDDDATRVDVTQPGVLLGTLRYMAPEALGGQAVDHRADLFAVGAVLYEMLAGTPAFAGTSVEANWTRGSRPPSPHAAPAWARLGRMHRVVGKLLTGLEVERGRRSSEYIASLARLVRDQELRRSPLLVPMLQQFLLNQRDPEAASSFGCRVTRGRSPPLKNGTSELPRHLSTTRCGSSFHGKKTSSFCRASLGGCGWAIRERRPGSPLTSPAMSP